MFDIILFIYFIYFFHVIVFSNTLEEHEVRLRQVLERLKDMDRNCLQRKVFPNVKYLGHIVSQNGVETDPGKIKALKTWPWPKNLKELRSFLGFSGYYRRFIQDYSKITKPLDNLNSGYPPLWKSSSKVKEKSGQYFHPKESFGERWTVSCQQAFETLTEKNKILQ